LRLTAVVAVFCVQLMCASALLVSPSFYHFHQQWLFIVFLALTARGLCLSLTCSITVRCTSLKP